MTCVDAILSAPSLAGLARVNDVGGGREVTGVWMAERFSDLEAAPAGSLAILGRVASESATDYRFDMALRWAALRDVGAVAAFANERWRPPLTAIDIASRAGVALISIPASLELTRLLFAVLAEVGGGPALALARATAGIDAVDRAEQAGADLDTLRAMVAESLGSPIERSADSVGLVAPHAHGDLAIAARLVLRAAADAAARLADQDAKARELPIRSRSELLAELLISESALNEDMLERARQLGIPLAGWHVAVRIEADNLTDVTPDEIGRFELLESVGQTALGAAAAAGGTWYLSRIARAIVLVWMTTSDPGAEARARASRSAVRALDAIAARFPALRLRAGVSTRTRARSECAPPRPRPAARSSLPALAESRQALTPTTRPGCSAC